jgi:iron complex outermembrane receptor protein/outer membrane receptor for ferrienterochelin and colicins
MAMRKLILMPFFLFCPCLCFSQYIFSFLVKNEATGKPVSNISVVARGDLVHTVTDSAGKARILIGPGSYTFHFSASGYETQIINLAIPLPAGDSVFAVLMKQTEKDVNGAAIYSFRNGAQIDNIPAIVKIIGADVLKNESGMNPAQVAGLLGNVAGIQTRQTSAVSGNTELRIHGLPGGYTQLLRDGLPLFGSNAANFSILESAPLELEQIEIIKGPGSPLYGGGAIAGIVNIISKKPKRNERERVLLLNQTSLQETNFNIYLAERSQKTGYTFFAGGNYQKQKDINNDGFSDRARVEGAFIHPTLYFYPNEKNTVSIGVNSVYHDRLGGDMEILSGYYSNFHQFFIQNQTYRNTFELSWDNELSQADRFRLRASTSSFNRSIGTHVFGMKAKQLSWYSEFSFVKKIPKHELVAGINFNGERLRKTLPDSTLISNYGYHTPGFFLQDDWRIHPKFTVLTNFRADFHNIYGAFVLPGLSALYKINEEVTMRFGGGMGYKIPTVFENEIDERDYRIIQPLQNIKAEKSAGIHWGINYKKTLKKISIAINQSFYFTAINDPLVMQVSASSISFSNASNPVTTTASETSVQFSLAGLEVHLQYTLADAKKKYDNTQPFIEFSSGNRIAGMISYKFSNQFRAHIEAAYTGRQYLEDGSRPGAWPLVSAMLQWSKGRFSFVLNAENINDFRQTKKQEIIILPVVNPRFKKLWAPVDGRVANLSMRISL